MQYLGLTGKKQVGKDTFADVLMEDGNVARFSFAEPLYAMLHAAFGKLPVDENGNVDKNGIVPAAGKTVRSLLQTLGTEWGRNTVNQNMWVNILDSYIEQYLADLGGDIDYVMFTDIRFDNEAAYVKRKGGRIIEIRRKSAPAGDSHSSEKGIDPGLVDHVIHNDGSMRSYRSAVRKVVKGA